MFTVTYLESIVIGTVNVLSYSSRTSRFRVFMKKTKQLGFSLNCYVNKGHFSQCSKMQYCRVQSLIHRFAVHFFMNILSSCDALLRRSIKNISLMKTL